MFYISVPIKLGDILSSLLTPESYQVSNRYAKIKSSSQRSSSMLGEVKTDNGHMHIHATFCRRTYMRPSSVGLMDALEVEPPSIDMITTSVVTVTATLFLVPKSPLSFHP